MVVYFFGPLCIMVLASHSWLCSYRLYCVVIRCWRHHCPDFDVERVVNVAAMSAQFVIYRSWRDCIVYY